MKYSLKLEKFSNNKNIPEYQPKPSKMLLS